MRYSKNDRQRQVPPDSPEDSYRTPWRRDFGRLIHCPSFRRLQGKTQLFPGVESDFFRNRLTHSLEVAQIAKAIAIKINNDLSLAKRAYAVEPDIVEFAALAHDLGHPPFGHLGEEVLDYKMYKYGGFESNAQTLRILSKLEKKCFRNGECFGLNLTFRSLAAVLKYNREIPFKRKFWHGPIKGYYASERDLVVKVRQHVSGRSSCPDFKTIECQIMDIADDIAYSTYDMEDCFKAGFLEPIDILHANDSLLSAVTDKVNLSLKIKPKLSVDDIREIIKSIFAEIIKDSVLDINGALPQDGLADFLGAQGFVQSDSIYKASKKLAESGNDRCSFTSKLVGRFVRAVIIGNIYRRCPPLSKITVGSEEHMEIEVLKHFVFQSQILSPRLKVPARRGKEIVSTIFDILTEKHGDELLPEDFQQLYQGLKSNRDRKRLICDFICGMTDRYAIEFYCRLTSEFPQTIFKPL